MHFCLCVIIQCTFLCLYTLFLSKCNFACVKLFDVPLCYTFFYINADLIYVSCTLDLHFIQLQKVASYDWWKIKIALMVSPCESDCTILL